MFGAEFSKEEAVSQSAVFCPEAPEASPGWKGDKQSMGRVRGVLKDAAS